VESEYGPPSTDPSIVKEGTIFLLNKNITRSTSSTSSSSSTVTKSYSSTIRLDWKLSSEFSFLYKIQGSIGVGDWCYGFLPCIAPTPVITYLKVWARVRTTVIMNLLVNVQAAASIEKTITIVPEVPIPYAGIGFKVGGVGFLLGFFVELRGRATVGVDGLFELSAGVSVSREMTSSFEYTPSSDAVPSSEMGPITTTKTFTWGGKVTAVLKIGLIPILSLNLVVKGESKSKSKYSVGISLQVCVHFFQMNFQDFYV
jgi:hypothetical protein